MGKGVGRIESTIFLPKWEMGEMERIYGIHILYSSWLMDWVKHAPERIERRWGKWTETDCFESSLLTTNPDSVSLHPPPFLFIFFQKHVLPQSISLISVLDMSIVDCLHPPPSHHQIKNPEPNIKSDDQNQNQEIHQIWLQNQNQVWRPHTCM